MKVDPVLISVIENRFLSTCREMGMTMLRTSRSPIFSEARDFTTAIFDNELRLVSQQAFIPVQMGAMPYAIKSIAKTFEGNVFPGDVFVLNDPYRGNNHPPDITVAKPVFWNGELTYWVASKGHHADIGGGGVAGYNPTATDAWEDSLRIPPAKLYEKGVYNRDLWNIILLNVHIPFLVEGDLNCQVGAANIGERSLLKLIERYDVDTLKVCADEFLSASERQMRKEIINIPDGIYYGEQKLEHDGVVKDKMLTVRVDVKVQGDEVWFDFTKSDQQVPGPFNSNMENTASSVFLAFFSCIGPNINHDEGSLKPLHIIAPKGNITNAIEPAASALNNPPVSEMITNAVWMALAEAIPEKVSAGWSRWCAPATAGINPKNGRPFAEIHFLSKGGGGATYGFDGWHHITPTTTMGGLRSPDPELHEVTSPYFILEYELLPDSGGPGKWRGGNGVIYRWVIEADNLGWVNFGGGISEEVTPFGLQGGKNGKPTRQYLISDGDKNELDVNCFSKVKKGDICEIYSAGGGGFGDPLTRPIEKVLEDARNEIISLESAIIDYGVAIDKDTMTVDEEKTQLLRNRVNKA